MSFLSIKPLHYKNGGSMKTAVITGGSSGIGLAIAKRYAGLNYQVYSLDLNAPPVDSNINFIQCNMANETEINQAFETIHAVNKQVDVLVNNCGLQFMSPVDEFPTEKWKLLIDVMLTSPFLCTKAVLPRMKENKSGRIINISSVHGKLASPFKSAYVAAKHGVLGFAKVVAKEVGEYGITVNSICPGFVDTPLMRNQIQKQMELNNLSEEEVLRQIFLKDQDIKKLTTPDQVADLCEFLSGNAASTITGEAYSISGGWGA